MGLSMAYDNPLIKICGLWKGVSSRGDFLKGNTRDGEIILPPGSKLFVFTNDRKRGEKDPDYFLSASFPGMVTSKGSGEGFSDDSEPEKKPTRF